MTGTPPNHRDDHDDWMYDADDVPTAAQVLASAPEWLRRRDPHIVRALSQGGNGPRETAR